MSVLVCSDRIIEPLTGMVTSIFCRPFSDVYKRQDGTIGIMELLTACKLIPSRSEGRRLIQQGGISVDDQKVESLDYRVDEAALKKGVKIRKGKKVFHKAYME